MIDGSEKHNRQLAFELLSEFACLLKAKYKSLKKLLNSRLKKQRRCSLTKRYGVFGHTEEVSCIKQMK